MIDPCLDRLIDLNRRLFIIRMLRVRTRWFDGRFNMLPSLPITVCRCHQLLATVIVNWLQVWVYDGDNGSLQIAECYTAIDN